MATARAQSARPRPRPAAPGRGAGCGRPRRAVRLAVRRRAQRQYGSHRPARHPRGSRDERVGRAMGDQRLRPALRRPPPARRAPGRSRGPSPALHRRAGWLRGRVAAVRGGAVGRRAHRRPRGDRRGRGAHRPGGARAARRGHRRGATPAGARLVDGSGRRRRHRRPGAGRRHHRRGGMARGVRRPRRARARVPALRGHPGTGAPR